MPQKLSDKKRRISAAIEKVLIDEAQFLADKENVNLTDIIRVALHDYILAKRDNKKNNKKKTK